MSELFDCCDAVLVQFQAARLTVPTTIDDNGVEVETTRIERTARALAKGPMDLLLERKGASLERVVERLNAADLHLAGAHTQVRHRRDGRPYHLVTFTFRRKVSEAPSLDLLQALGALARARYQELSVSSSGTLMSILAKSPADPAIELDYLEDPVADAFGIVISRSIRKRERREGSDSTRKIVSPESLPAKPTSGDGQLDRLLADGWQIEGESEDGAHVTLVKGARTLTHHRPKASKNNKGRRAA